MPITYQEKYLRLVEALKDPVYYKEYQKKRLIRQRKYARDPEYVKKRNLSTADWRFRKERGLPTRPRNKIKPVGLIIPTIPKDTSNTSGNFDFQLVSSIQVDFS